MTVLCGGDQNPFSLEGRGGSVSRVRIKESPDFGDFFVSWAPLLAFGRLKKGC